MARYIFGLAVVASLQLAGTTSAKVDCDPAKPYWITAEDGAWMICAVLSIDGNVDWIAFTVMPFG